MANKTPLPPGVVWEDSPPPLPKGIVWDDGAPEETFMDKAKLKVKAVGLMGKDMLVSGMAAIPQQIGAMMGSLPPLPGPMLGMKLLGQRGKKSADKFEKENSDLKEIAPYLHAGVQGLTTGLVTAPTAATSFASGMAGAAGGLGAEAGYQATKGTGLEPLGALAGSVLTGGLAGFALGPKQSIAQRDIRLETEYMTPADWAEVAKTAKTFQRAGASTATAAEAFPVGSGVRSLAVDAMTSKGGEKLRDQISKRADDLTQMGNALPGLVDPRGISLSEATRNAAESAGNRLQRIKQATQRPLSNIGRMERSGQLPLIPEPMAKQLVKDFEATATKPQLPRTDALGRQDILPAFLDPNAPAWERMVLNPKTKVLEMVPQEGPQQSLSALMLNIAENTPSASSASAKAGQTIPKAGQNKARQAAFDTVYTMPSPYSDIASDASAEYLKRKAAWQTPAEEGPLRKIAGQVDPEGRQIAEARLSAVMDDGLRAGDTENVMRELAKGGADTKMIARALVAREVQDKPSQFANNLAPEAGGGRERQFQEMLRGADVNPQPLMDRINSSRQMTLTPSTTIKEMPQMLARQALLRPFRTLDMMLTKGSVEDINREMANLLSDPRNIPELQKIAMFDPIVRKAMTAASATLPGIQQGFARNEE